jgi:hypothetical protein
VAIIDDYQNVALRMADWSPVADRADITVFTDHLHDPDDVAASIATRSSPRPTWSPSTCGSATAREA